MIEEKLLKEIEEFCKINNIDNIQQEINNLLRIGFSYRKYGVSPFFDNLNFNFINDNNESKILDNVTIEDNTNKETVKAEKKEKPKKRIRIIKNE